MTDTFIRAVEVWVPGADRTLLEFSDGLYGRARGFGAISRGMCFGRGEGLPGQAWALGRPIILKQLANAYFLRARAAASAGLTCAIALPIFSAGKLSAVVVVFCGDDDAHVGAIELWHNAPEVSPELALDDGYYGGTAELFEFMSRHTRFRRGFGLPGLAWESGLPVFMADLGKGSRFLRADGALKVGINRGFALPCSSTDGSHYVMAFLSALATPIVRRVETWLPDADQRYLLRRDGFCESQGALDGCGLADRLARGQGALGRVMASGVPAIAHHAADEPGLAGAGARAAGLGALVALPIHRDGRLAAVVAWYF